MFRKSWPAFLFAFVFSIPCWSAIGLSTPFVDVVVRDVPLGQPYEVTTNEGKGIWINNRGIDPVTVEISPRPPTSMELQVGALAIPDPSWLVPDRHRVIVPAQGSVLVPLHLNVPPRKAFRHQTFQVMIWTRMVPENNQPMMIRAGVLSRLRFTTR